MPEFDVAVADPSLWHEAVSSLKASSARGIDGISAAELKALPEPLIERLAHVMSHLATFPPWFMVALTIPLPKVAGQVRVGQVRPITIFAQLYRTWSRVVSQQILSRFSSFLPSSITGFLRHRGPLDASMSFAFFLERSLVDAIPHSGLVLDLVKCFNTICRCSAGQAMQVLGVPGWVISMWQTSLAKMQRLWMMNRQCSETLETNNGCPEGDSMSIVAILALSYLWVKGLDHTGHSIRATCYADNWGWSVANVDTHSAALQVTCCFTESCRMKVGWEKSWTWATTVAMSKDVNETFAVLLPHLDLPHVTNAQDLGCVHTYRGCPKLGQFVDRLSRSHDKLLRLQHMPHDCQVKSKLVMGAAYPTAFYGVELLPLGEHHLQQMRPKVSNAFLGPNGSRNSALAIACMPGLDDPLVFILCRVLRSARRFLLGLDSADSAIFLQIASNHTARGCDCHGPAGCLAYYLSLLDWCIDEQGHVTVLDGLQLSLWTTGSKTWKYWLEVCRHQGFLERFTKRDILHGLTIDAIETKRLLKSQDASALTQLVNEISGAFQTAQQKQKWASDATSQCHFCDQSDSRFHRLYECGAFEHIRLPYKPLLDELAAEGCLLHELPVLFQHPDHDTLHTIAHHHVEAVISSELLTHLHGLERAGHRLHFYTDGSLLFPTLATVRHGAYSLVLDTCMDDFDRRHAVDIHLKTGLMPPSLQPIAVARVTGRQTIYRAELFAVVILVENLHHTQIHVDSQSVLDTVQRCQNARDIVSLQADADFDLVSRLWRALQNKDHVFIKVRAHADVSVMTDWQLIYRTLGNQRANDAAISANRHMYPSQAAMWTRMANDVSKEAERIRNLFKLHLELFRARAQQEQQDAAQASHGLERERPDDQLLLLQNWQVEEVLVLPRLKNDCTSRSVMGPRLSQMFLQWARAIDWPADHVLVPDDPGITYLELAVSWMHFHRCYLPVRRMKSDVTFLFLPVTTDECQAMQVTLTEVSWMMAYWAQQLNQLCEPWVLPPISIGNCRSLYRLGMGQHAKGYLRRPKFPCQEVVCSQLGELACRHGSQLPQQMVTVDVLPWGTLRDDLRDSWALKQERAKREIQRVKKLSR
eukprot:Skav201480  [mRNA]  locus=scaffold828:134544:137840:- [translate_table: standard]